MVFFGFMLTFFFLIPLFLLLLNFYWKSKFVEEVICNTDEEGTETCEKTTSFGLATYWITINLISMVTFFIFYLADFSYLFIAQCKKKALAKKITKPLGGYAFDDPSRVLQNRESIYNLAFLVNLD